MPDTALPDEVQKRVDFHLQEVRFHRAMAVASAGTAQSDEHREKMLAALAALKQIALDNAQAEGR